LSLASRGGRVLRCRKRDVLIRHGLRGVGRFWKVGPTCTICRKSAREHGLFFRPGTGEEGKLADKKIKVLLADDHAMFRQGVREMLSTDEEIEVVGEAEDGRVAVLLTDSLKPDVVLLDVEMPVMGARQSMERMLDVTPSPRVVIVTMHDDPRLVRELIGLGASAYLVKSATIEELHAAVRTAAGSPPGDVIIPPEAADKPTGPDDLSRRELEVLLMVARGMSNQQIAVSLYLSEATVKRHLANIYPKIGVSSRGEAVRLALSKEWISPRDITDGDAENF
jgi:DNA-binding NarL/FixJ family response regulator